MFLIYFVFFLLHLIDFISFWERNDLKKWIMNVYFPTNLASPCSPYCGSTSPPPTTLNSLHFDKLYTKSRPHGRDFAGKPIISIISRAVICSRVKRLVTSSYFHFCWYFSSFFLNAHYNKILRVMKIWKYLNHFYINNKILYI